MEIIIEGTDWGGAVTENVKHLLEDVQSQLLRHFHEPPEGRVRVQSRPQERSPRVLYRKDPGDDYIVWLTVQGNYWARYSYQFSHEFCHILTDFDRLHSSANQWFHEALCELASLFVLKQMSETWRDKPPYPNWADYASALGSYADDIINKDEHRLSSGTDIRSWILANEPSLRANASQRTLNGVVAVRLLPLFQREPTQWGCIRHLPPSNADFFDYLAEWEESCPDRHKPFVAGLRSNLTESSGA